MKKLFTHYLFLPLSLPLLFSIIGGIISLVNNGFVETYGINKTVGWAWDITNSVYWQFLLYPFYLLTYSILALFKVTTKYELSLIHFCLIVVPMGTFFIFPMVILLAPILSFLVFVMNVISSLRSKLRREADGKNS